MTLLCTCCGYHYAHRPGSPMCEDNPFFRFNRARREGLSEEEVTDAFLDDIFLNNHKPSKDQTCPF